MRRFLGIIIAVVFAALLLSGCSYNFSRSFTGGSSTDTGNSSIEGAGINELEVLAGVGTVTVSKGPGSDVDVRYEKKVRGSSSYVKEVAENIIIDTKKDGDKIIVEVRSKDDDSKDFWSWLSSKYKNINVSVDLDITVPGNIAVFTVSNGVGDITINDVKGRMVINSGVGEIKLRNVAMTGNCVVNNGTGDITIDGDISEMSDIDIQTGVGEVNLRFPEDSKFSIDATTGVGDISGNLLNGDFSGFVGGTLKQDINGGGASVTVDAGTGDIAVNRN